MSKKKVMALLLAVTMVMGSSITVFAAEGDNTGSTQGAGTSEGHVDKEVLNVILPTIASGTTPFAYTMDPERLIQGTDASKYAEGTVFPDAATDTGVYFLVGENQYANTSNTLQAINRSSCDVTFTVKVKTTQNTAKDIALADSDTPATDSAELYLGLKVGQTSQVVSATEATVTKTVAGTPANFEIAVDENKAYVYREKESATTWKAIDISMTGAVSKFAIAADTTAPTVEVTWSYAKAAEGATVDTADQVEYNVTPVIDYENATAMNLNKGSSAVYANYSDLGFTSADITSCVVKVDSADYAEITPVESDTALKITISDDWSSASSVKIYVVTSDEVYVYTYK